MHHIANGYYATTWIWSLEQGTRFRIGIHALSRELDWVLALELEDQTDGRMQ
jgi:hypothetical protein